MEKEVQIQTEKLDSLYNERIYVAGRLTSVNVSLKSTSITEQNDIFDQEYEELETAFLKHQQDAMKLYLNALNKRITLLKQKLNHGSKLP